MRISAPSLKLDMVLTDVEIRDDRPIIICKIGSYKATTELSRDDIRSLLRYILRPKIAMAFARVLFSKAQRRGNTPGV